MSKNFKKNYYSKNDFVQLRTELDNLKIQRFELSKSKNVGFEKEAVNTVIVMSLDKSVDSYDDVVMDIFQCDNNVYSWLVNVYPQFTGDLVSIYHTEKIKVYFDVPF